MKFCFQDYKDQFVVPYTDDLLVFSKDFNNRFTHLRLTLQQLWQYSKKYQGKRRLVSADGYKLHPNNVKAVTELVKDTAKIVWDVRPVQGMVGYFRRYIPSFSKAADPFYHILKKGATLHQKQWSQRMMIIRRD